MPGRQCHEADVGDDEDDPWLEQLVLSVDDAEEKEDVFDECHKAKGDAQDEDGGHILVAPPENVFVVDHFVLHVFHVAAAVPRVQAEHDGTDADADYAPGDAEASKDDGAGADRKAATVAQLTPVRHCQFNRLLK